MKASPDSELGPHKPKHTESAEAFVLIPSGSPFCWANLGIVLILAGKMNLLIGRLPGDIVYRGKNTTFFFPLMTSILLSIILSLVLYFVNRMR
jgi:hypothetical protein